MVLPNLRDRLKSGPPVLSAWSGLTDPQIHHILLGASFDAITFDMQHGLHDVRSVEAGISRAAFLGKPALVRLPVEDRANAARMLDLGASAVIMPMIEGAADARLLVDAVKYPPRGQRSFGPGQAAALHGYETAGHYVEAANDETLAFAMIETRAAFDSLGEILSIDGLDGVFVGPSDLSIALAGGGVPAPTADLTQEAVRAVRRSSAEAGKFAAIYAVTPEEAKGYLSFGYDLVCLSSDAAIIASGAAALLQSIR